YRRPTQARERFRRSAQRADPQPHHADRSETEKEGDRERDNMLNDVEGPETAARGQFFFSKIARQKPQYARSDPDIWEEGGNDGGDKCGRPPPIGQIPLPWTPQRRCQDQRKEFDERRSRERRAGPATPAGDSAAKRQRHERNDC